VVSRLGLATKLMKASSGEIKPVLALLAFPCKLAYELAEKFRPPRLLSLTQSLDAQDGQLTPMQHG
jgi:hypothetical protein